MSVNSMLLRKNNLASKYAIWSVTVITSRQKLLNHVSRSTAAAQLTALSLSPQSFCSWSLFTIALIHLLRLTHLCSPLLPGLDKGLFINDVIIFGGYPDQGLTSRAFWLQVGFGSGLTKKFGFRVGFGYWLYLAVLGCTGIRLHWAVLGCGGIGLMSLQMIHEAYMPVYKWTKFFLRTD